MCPSNFFIVQHLKVAKTPGLPLYKPLFVSLFRDLGTCKQVFPYCLVLLYTF